MNLPMGAAEAESATRVLGAILPSMTMLIGTRLPLAMTTRGQSLEGPETMMTTTATDEAAGVRQKTVRSAHFLPGILHPCAKRRGSGRESSPRFLLLALSGEAGRKQPVTESRLKSPVAEPRTERAVANIIETIPLRLEIEAVFAAGPTMRALASPLNESQLLQRSRSLLPIVYL